MVLVIVILTFLFIFTLFVAIGSFISNRRGQVAERLNGIQKMSFDSSPEDVLKIPFLHRVVFPFLSGVGKFFGRIAPWEIKVRVEKKIMHAGSPKNLNFYSLFAVQIILGSVLLLLSLYLQRIMQLEGARMIFSLTLLISIGFFLPYVMVHSKADARQLKIRRSLPDVLDLLLVSIEAGLGFDMAMKKVTQQMPGPLSEEIKRALDEIRMGGDREAALRGIAKRNDIRDLHNFISSVIQSEQLGSNIANTLRAQSDYLRQKRRQWAEEMANKAPVKMIFPLLFFIFPALFVVILGPAVINLLRFLAGGL